MYANEINQLMSHFTPRPAADSKQTDAGKQREQSSAAPKPDQAKPAKGNA